MLPRIKTKSKIDLIVDLYKHGRSTLEIASILRLSPRDVGNYIALYEHDLAAKRQRAERQGGFDRPSAFDPHDGGRDE